MKKITFLILLISCTPAFAQDYRGRMDAINTEIKQIDREKDSLLQLYDDLRLAQVRTDLKKWGLPAVLPSEKVVFHSAYALVYDEPFEQAKWVAHIILPDVLNGSEGRSNDFRPDSLISTGSAVESDYFLKTLMPDSTWKYDGFGYDRGHLAPSADFRYSKKALSESYLYSNMSPQLADFNRGRWAELEDAIRQYAIDNHSELFVVTGPVLKPGLPRIERGTNKVAIPEIYFKVVYDKKNSRGIGFLMRNQRNDEPWYHYAVSIDSVEQVTGISFFPALDASLKQKVEAMSDAKPWRSDIQPGEVEPMNAENLPRNNFNTLQAKFYQGKNETVTICGTVVSTKKSAKGNVFLNLDRKFPNQVFTVTIFKDKISNFSYQPHVVLDGKRICVTGKVVNSNGTPGINVENEKEITIMP
ncbi:MAG: DNA/RNA non-specific endonuclease [Chitinophagaceae bacterium]|nr:DNA/RNA non-specific endonuclease [Bacteroidota bacterium]MCC6258552.1 DNA/RNA non-specific endonuclease [Chitinophagaceae bacterium]MCW5916285.1 DNA/RNA non-specific endonuclease [Ferruginibacter sp.]